MTFPPPCRRLGFEACCGKLSACGKLAHTIAPSKGWPSLESYCAPSFFGAGRLRPWSIFFRMQPSRTVWRPTYQGVALAERRRTVLTELNRWNTLWGQRFTKNAANYAARQRNGGDDRSEERPGGKGGRTRR